MPRYQQIRLLGKGGMGIVHEVADSVSGRRVALKTMLEASARQVMRFKREFRVMADLQHPNLVGLYDLGIDDGGWFFTMELVEGTDLLTALRHVPGRDPALDLAATISVDQPPPSATAASNGASATSSGAVAGEAAAPRSAACDLERLPGLIGQMLHALEYLHARGIVHRDIKPSNVLVSRSGEVKVLDFGLASAVDRSQVVSQAGAMVGTVAYMAPEQVTGDAVTPAADLYAVGCLLFELLTGRLPFTGPPARQLHARVNQPPPRVDRYIADIPPALADVCEALMDRDPTRRPSIAEVRVALGIGSASPTAGELRTTGDPGREAGAVFVGREHELSVLEGRLARALEGEPQLVWIEGASGIGKSGLAARFVKRARAQGVRCLRGRCYEREHLPFVAFDRAIDALTLTLSRWPAEQLAPMQPALREAARIFPALRMLLVDSDSGEWGAAGRHVQTQHAVAGLADVLAQLQRREPLVLVLDDLHWADEESVELLGALLARVRGPERWRLLLLCMSRVHDRDEPVARRLQAVIAQAEVATDVLRLEPLNREESARLVAAAGRDLLDARTLSDVAAQSEGNPLLAWQLIEHLTRLEPAVRETFIEAASGLGTVLDMLIAQLGGDARRVLQLAASAGGDVDESLLRDASGLSAEAFAAAVAELGAAQMLRASGTWDPDLGAAEGADARLPRGRRLDVYHDRIREAVYAGLEPDPRAGLHRALALALEARQGTRRADVEALLRHWGEAGERHRRRALALEAAAQAERKLAFRRAATLMQTALADPDDDDDPPLTRAARWEHLGDLCEHGGVLDSALQAYQRAVGLWERAPDGPGRALALLRLRARLAETFIMAGEIGQGRDVFDGVLGAVGLSTRRAAWRQRLVMWGLRARWRFVQLLPKAWRRLEPSAWNEERLRLLTLSMRMLAPLWPQTATEASLRGKIMSMRAGDEPALQRLLAGRVLGLILQGRPTPHALQRARLDLDASEALATRHRVAAGLAVVMVHRALHALPTDLGRARRIIDDALEAIERQGMQASYDGVIARALRIMILFRQGDQAAALKAIDFEVHAQGNLLNIPICLMFQVLIHAQRGELPEATRTLEALEACFVPIPLCGLTSRLQIARVTVNVAAGRFAEAVALLRESEASWTEPGVAPRGDFHGMWATAALEALLGAMRQAGAARASGRETREIRRRARALARRGTLDHACMGYRALALVEHRAGRGRAALRARAAALELSEANASPHRRWLCLEAAREIAPLTQDMVSELRALRERGRFRLPEAWTG